MYQVLPFVAAINLALPDCINIPVEIWSMIFRLLDPVSLLTATRTYSLWNDIILGDPVLKEKIHQHLEMERSKRQQEIFNPGLMMSVTRSGPDGLFQTNGKKVVRQRPTVVNHQVSDFYSTSHKNKNKNGKYRVQKLKTPTGPYKPMRF
ncbi:uncharacterized protein BDFB_002379 [Asbolus verrucosus]|uniref:F-box domain-containing protein n=1 Tax=Asbolus verrucosus TaxID=1661398 RepID=A0A482W233_ASBVE|nr:uncharacterized protein BDFB_002379 [Asbolus verrucosus]